MNKAELMERYNIVKSMDTIVKSVNDEDAYYRHWLYIVPDCADDGDYLSIAEDDELFADTAKSFLGIMKRYAESGLYVARKLYTIEE